MNLIRPIAAALALFFSAAAANASLVMSWSFTKTGETTAFGSGTFTAEVATDPTVASLISYNESNGGPGYVVGQQKDFYVMTLATGTINGAAISLLAPGSTYGEYVDLDGYPYYINTVIGEGFAGNDNVVLEPNLNSLNANAYGYFTSFGVSFGETGPGTTMWNLFVSSTAGGPTYQLINSADSDVVDGTFTLVTTSGGRPPDAVPIPAAAWLLLSGVGGLFMAGRRRSAQASAR